MLEVQTLTQITAEDLARIASGYTSDRHYVVDYRDTATHMSFELVLAKRNPLYVKVYDHFDDATVQRYAQMLESKFSFGAFDDHQLVGLLIGEPHHWNHSVAVWEFHVAETYRRQGIGRRLMDAVAEQARRANFRILVCETQNTNAPAIQAYRKLGFRVEGVDISYYSNADYPDGEVAIFMKRRLV